MSFTFSSSPAQRSGRRHHPGATRRGFSLVEIIVSMVILGLVGTAMVRLMMGQARFFERQSASREARVVSRSALNMLISEMRMIEATNGVVAANAKLLTLRVPYALGIVCGTSGIVSTVSLLPVDSAAYVEPGFSGYAWRNGTGTYSYVEVGASVTSGSAALCTSAGITTLTGGKIIGVSPALPLLATPGSAVLLYRRITYEFGPSTVFSGRTALHRKVVATNATEELASPFDSTSRFRFYALNSGTATDAVPPLANIRGIELSLLGASENVPRGAATFQKSPTITSVFFRNRLQ